MQQSMCGQTNTIIDRNFRERNLIKGKTNNALRKKVNKKIKWEKIKEMERKDHLRIIKVIFIHDATYIAFP